MSASHHANSNHGHGHHDHDGLQVHVSLKGYAVGFILSVILTAIPFWLVMAKVIPSKSTTIVVLLAFAAVQVIVHMVYFLHVNARAEGGWNLMGLIFTLVLLAIVLAGSIWVMYHLDYNMMPGMRMDAAHTQHLMQHMREMP